MPHNPNKPPVSANPFRATSNPRGSAFFKRNPDIIPTALSIALAGLPENRTATGVLYDKKKQELRVQGVHPDLWSRFLYELNRLKTERQVL